MPVPSSPFGRTGYLPERAAAPELEPPVSRLSAAELDAFLSGTTDVVLVLDRDGRYIRVVSNASGMLYAPREELIGRRLDEVLPAGTAREFMSAIGRVLSRQTPESLRYALQIGVARVWFDATLTPTRDGTVLWVARDSSARQATEKALLGREREVRDLFEAAFDGMLVCGPDLRCLEVNARLCDLLGRSRPDILARGYADLVDPAELAVRPLRLRELLAKRRLVTERALLRGDGTTLATEVGTSLLDDGRILFVIRDVTERKRAESTVRALALIDDLTGIYNRRGFLALAEREWERANAEGHGALLVMFDLDNLKSVNDTFGHPEGDAALAGFAKVLLASFRGVDVVGRLGGDEFAAFVVPAAATPDPLEAPDARLVSTEELIRARFERHLAIHNTDATAAGRLYVLAASAGIARMHAPQRGESRPPASLSALLAEADGLLYEEKRSRKHG